MSGDMRPDIDRAALMHAVWDGVTDRLDPELEATDEFYDWYAEEVEKPIATILCYVYGHEPIRDVCGLPEHDVCAWCSKSMPGAADEKIYEWIRYENLNGALTKAHLRELDDDLTACGRQIMTGVTLKATLGADRCGQCMRIAVNQ